MIYKFNNTELIFELEEEILFINIKFNKFTKTDYITTLMLIYILYCEKYSKIRRIKITGDVNEKYILKYLHEKAFIYIPEENLIKKKRYFYFEKYDYYDIIMYFYQYFYNRPPILGMGQIKISYNQDFCDFHNYYSNIIEKTTSLPISKIHIDIERRKSYGFI